MPTEHLLASAADLAGHLHRLAHLLAARHADFGQTVLLGLQNGGAPVAERLQHLLTEITGTAPRLGLLDATFHRDDYRRRPLHGPPAANATPPAKARNIRHDWNVNMALSSPKSPAGPL